LDAVKPPRRHLQKIANRRSAGTRHKSDPPRKQRQRALPRRFKQSFRRQARLKLLERKLQRPQPRRLDLSDVDLIRAPRWIHVEIAVTDDLLPFFKLKSQPAGHTPPNHRLD